MLKNLIFVFILLIHLPQVLSFTYAIEIPKLKCSKGKVENGTTTISVTGKDVGVLKFEWMVNFNITNNCTSQRCTLMAWRSVQDLYKALNYASKPTEIKVNNTILLGSVRYKLNVTTISNNTIVESKEYVLECDTGADTATPPKDKFHSFLRLLGPNITYPDMMYTINAVVVDLDSPYHFQWEIQDQSEKLVKIDHTKGSMLSFRSNLLLTDQQYIIKCSVVDTKGEPLATSTHDLVILSRGISLNIPLKKLQVGVNRPFKLNAYFEDVDNLNGSVKLQWTCRTEKDEKCPNVKTENSTFLENLKFSKVGRYTIQITAEKNDAKVSDSVEITVIRDGYVSIEVDDFATPVDPSKEITVPVYVTGMVAGCTLQWMCLNLTGYSFVDLTKAPGNVHLLTKVTVKSNEFLNELDEYSNDTVDKDYNLVLSKPKDSWMGLGSDTSYMFRLNVTCPLPDNDDSRTEQVLKHVVVTALICVVTSPIPTINDLSVTPNAGVALTTTFHYHSNDDFGSVKGAPYLYKFGYIVNNRDIFLSNVLDEKSWNSVLPYVGSTDKGVNTVLECCNTYAMCSQIKGPKVLTSLPTYSDDDKTRFQFEIRQMMERQEYSTAFAYATGVLLTYNSLKDTALVKNFEKFITELANAETKKLLKLIDSGNKIWITPSNNFIRDAGLILDHMSTDELLNSVVTLRNKLSKTKDVEYLSKLQAATAERAPHYQHNSDLPPVIRSKRETDRITLEEVKSYLVISELIITSSKDKKAVQQEKEHLVNQVDKFMVQLCSTVHKKPQPINLDLKTVSLALEKLNKNNINRYFNILRETNSWDVNGRIKLGKCFVENVGFTDHLCMGKAIFKEYFDKPSYVYMVKVYGTKHSEQVKIQDMFCEAVLELPLDKYDPSHSAPRCSLWKNKWDESECKTLQIRSKTIQCQCGHLGYYSLEYSAISTSTVTAITAAITTTTVAVTPKVTITTQQPIESTVKTTVKASSESTLITESPSTTSYSSVESTTTKITTKAPTPVITEKIIETTEIPKPTTTLAENKSDNDIAEKLAEVEYETVCYVVIGASVMGTCTLLFGIKRILATTRKVYKDDSDFPQYEKLPDEELLDDFSISN
ncbi:uncharacterized protein LOC116169571 isoform X1 [Photinus pyralis]|uniref:uncharacterized protein LOC116169571 isoform X1 n=1 Tax=Photinus pyralis TaxID=7054 RepID=UPI0012677F83|nr:uncharacterized protein LOC116169571 isoform X1 [Photinus pyralis]